MRGKAERTATGTPDRHQDLGHLLFEGTVGTNGHRFGAHPHGYGIPRSLVWALPLTPQEDAQILCDRFEGSEALLPTLQSILIARTAGSIRFVDSVLEKPLQLADLAAGTIRRHLDGDANEGRFRYVAPVLYHLGVVPVKQ